MLINAMTVISCKVMAMLQNPASWSADPPWLNTIKNQHTMVTIIEIVARIVRWRRLFAAQIPTNETWLKGIANNAMFNASLSKSVLRNKKKSIATWITMHKAIRLLVAESRLTLGATLTVASLTGG